MSFQSFNGVSQFASVIALDFTMGFSFAPCPEKEKLQAAETNYWWIGVLGGVLVFIIAIVLIALMIRYNYPRQEYLCEYPAVCVCVSVWVSVCLCVRACVQPCVGVGATHRGEKFSSVSVSVSRFLV